MIRAERLEKQFGEKKVLRGISLTVEKGDVVGIIGGSGEGKSTLLRCLSSLERDFMGEVLFEGAPFAYRNDKELRKQRRKLGMIFQNFCLLSSRTVEENIALPLEMEGKQDPEKVAELIALIGLRGKEKRFPGKLSGGEKQRVAIARALASDPDILFCDEATSALDPKSKNEILDLLLRLRKELGLTMVVITHEMDVVRKICNRVLVLHEGRIVETGSVVDIFAFPEHPVTKSFLQTSSSIDPEFREERGNDALLLTLRFRGENSEKPILSRMIAELGVEVNILGGRIDRVDSVSIGSLTVTVEGEKRNEVLSYLEGKGVVCEVMGW